ncbi:RNA-directed DNA polymerase, eukaryota [Tanacetum coccineum]
MVVKFLGSVDRWYRTTRQNLAKFRRPLWEKLRKKSGFMRLLGKIGNKGQDWKWTRCDLSRHVMGKVKDINSIPNLHTLLYKEGFPDVKLSYLGDSPQPAVHVRLCIKPKLEDTILESSKLFVEEGCLGKVFMARAKELFAWTPTFVEYKETEYISDDEGLQNSVHQQVGSKPAKEDLFDSDVEGVPDTIFEDNIVSPIKSVCHSSGKEGEHFSEDPFGIYEMLNRNPTHVAKELDPSLSHPPGFTSVESQQEETNGGDKELPNSAAPNVVNNSEVPANESCNGESDGISSLNSANGGSFLDVMDGLVRVGQSMGYKMDGCLKDLENIIGNHGDSNSGGILCIWEASVFKKEFVTVSDNFVAIYGSWCSNNSKLLIVVVYAPQSSACKRLLWEYISSLVTRWNGETIVMGDFNVMSSWKGILLRGLILPEKKMSKLDRFLVSEGIVSMFPSITAICLDKHLSDHRPILLHEVVTDFGPSPFRMYHSWFRRDGFDLMVEQAWASFSHNDGNSLIRFKKKLQALKIIIRRWIKSKNLAQSGIINSIKEELIEIDKIIDSGSVNDELLLKRMDLSRQLFDTKYVDSCDSVQKSKIKWGIEGDENSKYFHGIINKKRSLLAIRGVLVDGDWCIDPGKVKDVFMQHFAARFKKPNSTRFKLNFVFPNRLSDEQVENMDQLISRDEIKSAVWSCGENKSPGPDGYTFEFFRRYWNFIGPDLCSAVECFFDKGSFPMGNNASFIALIPKVPDAKYVTDYRPISLIGSVYKVITKVLANRLATVVSDLVSDTQSAFVANRQILDGPFILNEVLTWCKRKRKQAMIFKVDFAKAYDSVRWDYLMEVLQAFGFGPNWCKWVRGTLSSAMASVLINGSPSEEFAFYRGLKQGDPLAPFLFILVMESLHLSFTRTVNEGLFTGLQLNESMTISHLFYADDAVFIGEWSDSNMENIVIILKSFFLASGLKINIQKSHIMGVGVADGLIHQAASLIGCAIMKTPFRYLGVLVDGLFRVKDIRSSIDSILLPSDAISTRWVKYVPIKINVFVWRARLDRLPTRVNLDHRGVIIDSVLCPLCRAICACGRELERQDFYLHFADWEDSKINPMAHVMCIALAIALLFNAGGLCRGAGSVPTTSAIVLGICIDHNNGGAGDGYGSEDFVVGSGSSRERKKDSSFVPPVIYSVLGSLRHLAVGPVSIASLVMGTMLNEAVSYAQDPVLYFKLAFDATLCENLNQGKENSDNLSLSRLPRCEQKVNIPCGASRLKFMCARGSTSRIWFLMTHCLADSDVYAFGDGLFKLLSRRRAVDTRFSEELNLANWAQK